MLGRAQDALGVAVLKSSGMNRFGVTSGLVDTITGSALSLMLQGATSTRGDDVFA
jgi:hypothetical protein